MDYDCISDCNKYLEKKGKELKGCTEDYKMSNVVFSTFNHLSVHFPEAYKHMLKVWGV